MHIGDVLKGRLEQKTKRGTYWTDMVKECVDNINKERDGKKYKKVSFIMIRNKVSHLDDKDLAYFLSICKDAKTRGKSFGFVFFGALKVRK